MASWLQKCEQLRRNDPALTVLALGAEHPPKRTGCITWDETTKIAEALENNTYVTALCISQPENAILFSHFLRTSPSLRGVVLTDRNKVGVGVSSLLQCLASNKTLMSLHLCHVIIERPAFLETLISTSKTLEELSFKEHDTASLEVAQALRTGLVRNQTLTFLKLVAARESKSHLGEVVFGLYDHPRLKFLKIDTPLTETFSMALGSILPSNSSIKHLELGLDLELNVVPAGQTSPTKLLAPILVGLAWNKGIHNFTLRGVRGNSPLCAEAWTCMLRNNTALKVVDLSTLDDVPSRGRGIYKLGRESACGITQGLCMNNTLKKLDLGGCLDANSFDGAAWRDMLSQNTSLKELVLTRFCIFDGAVGSDAFPEIQGLSDGLAQNKSLRVLDISLNALEPSAVQSLSLALKHNTTLESLNLADNQIAVDGAMAIKSMLEANTFLRRINLSLTELGEDEGGLALIEGLSQNHRLESLDISCNSLGNETFRAICLGLQGNTSLRELNVERNNIHLEACATELNGLLASSSLRTLRIGGNQGILTEDEIFEIITEGNNNRGIELLAEGLRTNESLIELGLHGVDCRNTGLRFLAEALTENSTLETLDIAENDFDSDGVLHFLGLLPEMQGLKEVNGFLDQLGEERVCVALAESLRENQVFCRISKSPNVSARWRLLTELSLQLKDEIHYRLKMNEYGRRVLKPPLVSQLPVAIWPHMLATASATHTGSWSLLFHFLQNLPPDAFRKREASESDLS
jgi:Ran GTPase-activating protein (RanGAP) involved in mRNA processing and transport